MTYKTKPITYKIATLCGHEFVNGYAIDSGLPVRICVHRINDHTWVCDHYDSGYWFGSRTTTMEEAVKFGVARMRKAIKSGELDRAIKECGL
jgi:hypothetical protein